MSLKLVFREVDRIDPNLMVAAFARSTGCEPECAIVDLVEALSMGVAGLRQAGDRGDLKTTQEQAEWMAQAGQDADLLLLSVAARNVLDCATGKDAVALSATVARCLRLGDGAVTRLWAAEFGHG